MATARDGDAYADGFNWRMVATARPAVNEDRSRSGLGAGDPLLEKLHKTFFVGRGGMRGKNRGAPGGGVTVLSQSYTVKLGWFPSYSLRPSRRRPGPGVLP